MRVLVVGMFRVRGLCLAEEDLLLFRTSCVCCARFVLWCGGIRAARASRASRGSAVPEWGVGCARCGLVGVVNFKMMDYVAVQWLFEGWLLLREEGL